MCSARLLLDENAHDLLIALIHLATDSVNAAVASRIESIGDTLIERLTVSVSRIISLLTRSISGPDGSQIPFERSLRTENRRTLMTSVSAIVRSACSAAKHRQRAHVSFHIFPALQSVHAPYDDGSHGAALRTSQTNPARYVSLNDTLCVANVSAEQVKRGMLRFSSYTVQFYRIYLLCFALSEGIYPAALSTLPVMEIRRKSLAPTSTPSSRLQSNSSWSLSANWICT